MQDRWLDALLLARHVFLERSSVLEVHFVQEDPDKALRSKDVEVPKLTKVRLIIDNLQCS
jgi:hypothetical protein